MFSNGVASRERNGLGHALGNPYYRKQHLTPHALQKKSQTVFWEGQGKKSPLNISYESSGKLLSPLGRLSFSLGWQELE